MRQRAQNDLTIIQYILLIHGAQVGIGVLSLPRELAGVAGTDGWISLLLGWGMAVVASLLITSVMKQYPTHTIIELLPLLLGKWLGKACMVLVILYGLLSCLMVVANTVGILNVWILSRTPAYLIVILLVVPTYLVLRQKVQVLGRYAELIFYLTLWMPIVLMTPIKDSQWLNLLPIVKDGWAPILSGTKSTIDSFLGFELAFFLYPFLRNKKYAAFGIVVANTLSLMVFMQVTLLCFAFFSPDEITQYMWPTLIILKSIEYRFLERIDIIFLSFYLLVLSTTIFPYAYFTVYSSSQLVCQYDHRKHLRIFLLLIVVASCFYTPTFIDLKNLTQIWGETGLIYGYILPLLISVPVWFLHRSARERKA